MAQAEEEEDLEEDLEEEEERELTPFAQNLYNISTVQNPCVATMIIEIDGKLKLNEIIDLFNKKWLKYHRLKSYIKDGNKFKIIKGFDCKYIVSQFYYDKPLSSISTQNYIKTTQINNMYNSNNFKINTNDKYPLWRMKNITFKDNKSIILLSFHHSIGDLSTVFELIKVLCNIKTKLTDHHKLITKYSSFMNMIISYIKWFYFLIISLTKFMFVHYLKYYINKLIYRNKKYVFEPKNGLKYQYVTDDIFISENVIKNRRKSLNIKHSFNDFLLCIIAETLIHFMKTEKGYLNEEIPNEMNIFIPVNTRPFYDNWPEEHVFGNKLGTYQLRLPLDPNISFIQRLNIINKRLNFSKSINEYDCTYQLMKFESTFFPGKAISWLMDKTGCITPMIVSGVKIHNFKDKEWNLNGKQIDKMYGCVPLTIGIPVGFSYMTQPHGKMSISVQIDCSIAGDYGANIMMRCLKHVLKTHGIATANLISNL